MREHYFLVNEPYLLGYMSFTITIACYAYFH